MKSLNAALDLKDNAFFFHAVTLRSFNDLRRKLCDHRVFQCNLILAIRVGEDITVILTLPILYVSGFGNGGIPDFGLGQLMSGFNRHNIKRGLVRAFLVTEQFMAY